MGVGPLVRNYFNYGEQWLACALPERQTNAMTIRQERHSQNIRPANSQRTDHMQNTQWWDCLPDLRWPAVSTSTLHMRILSFFVQNGSIVNQPPLCMFPWQLHIQTSREILPLAISHSQTIISQHVFLFIIHTCSWLSQYSKLTTHKHEICSCTCQRYMQIYHAGEIAALPPFLSITIQEFEIIMKHNYTGR